MTRAIWRGSNALPRWSYQGCDGNPATVEVYSVGDSAELFINRKSVGKEKLRDCKAEFHVVYERGELSAISYDENGKRVAGSALQSANTPNAIRITPERKITGDNIIYVNIDIVGQNGVVECNRDAQLTVSVSGGDLLAFGSANPRTEESFLTGKYTTWYGRSQAVIRLTGNPATIEVTSDSLPSAAVTVGGEKDV
jgi:hypothetical protein